MKKNYNKCVSKTHIDKRGMQLKLCATPHPLFKGNISVAACMLLYTIKINGGVECRCV